MAGTCFVKAGNQVTCVDSDDDKIRSLREGVRPIYDPLNLRQAGHRYYAVGRPNESPDITGSSRPVDPSFGALGQEETA